MRKLTNVNLLGLAILGLLLSTVTPASAKVSVSVGLFPTRKLFKATHSDTDKSYRKIYDEIMLNEDRVMEGEKRIVLVTAGAKTNLDINFDKVTNEFILAPENFKLLQGSDSADLAPGSSVYHSTVNYEMSKKILSCQNAFNAEVKMRRSSSRITLSMLAHTFTCIFKDSLAKVYVKKISDTEAEVTLRAVFSVKGSTFKKIGGDLPITSNIVRGRIKKDVRNEIRKTIDGLISLARKLN